MSFAAEAKLCAFYIMAQEAIYIHLILAELEHKQPHTSIQIDSSTVKAIIDNKVQHKRTKFMEMQFH